MGWCKKDLKNRKYGCLKKYIILFAIIILGYLASSAQVVVPISINRETLDSLGTEILDKGNVLAFFVAIASGNKIIYNQGFRHIDT